ncbi:Holliday junction branch migration protein RuvA [Lactobacillaceae bacterium L1_55_11]|nr:Holliday junction branch migration protein RuvA [Lactobacillaceae bacterium L1_55_11]
MYEYLQGIITIIQPAYLVVETKDGVGYRLYTANPYQFEEGQSQRLFVEQIVRENEISLYGFASQADKQVFDKLLSVSGIGPKSALAILAGGDIIGVVNAVEADDWQYLTQFPGVGKKTAQQIVLDLKGKVSGILPASADNQPASAAATSQHANQQALDDALLALSSLGYGNKDVQRVGKLLATQEAATTEEYLRQALKLLVKS